MLSRLDICISAYAFVRTFVTYSFILDFQRAGCCLLILSLLGRLATLSFQHTPPQIVYRMPSESLKLSDSIREYLCLRLAHWIIVAAGLAIMHQFVI
jgi:hypothetical protein